MTGGDTGGRDNTENHIASADHLAGPFLSNLRSFDFDEADGFGHVSVEDSSGFELQLLR